MIPTAIAAAVLSAAALIAAPHAVADPGDTVTYMITSDGPLKSVSYYDAMDEMQQVTNVDSTWQATFVSKATYGMYAVGAQTSGTQVSCQIVVNGKAVAQDSGVGRYTLANCAA